MPPDTIGMGDAMGAEPADAASPAPAPEGGGDQGPTTIFLSKEVLGGKTVKAGDTITCTIKSVDSETGGAEATVKTGSGGTGDQSEGGSIDAAFDKAMPPEPGEGTY